MHPTDDNQHTPLHYAKREGQTEAVDFLKQFKFKIKTAKSVKKARRKQTEDEVENILQRFNLGGGTVEKEVSKTKAKKKSKKPKRPQIPQETNQEPQADRATQAYQDSESNESDILGAAAVVDSAHTRSIVEDDGENDECTICFEHRNPTYLFSPCGHATFCKDCAERLYASAEKKCPDCRSTIKDIIRVFGTIRKA